MLGGTFRKPGQVVQVAQVQTGLNMFWIVIYSNPEVVDGLQQITVVFRNFGQNITCLSISLFNLDCIPIMAITTNISTGIEQFVCLCRIGGGALMR